MRDKTDVIETIARIMAEEQPCVALTGAGISVPSGIPDFRSRGGLWETFDPETYATAAAWRRSPGKVWDLFRAVGKLLVASKPNPAHVALGELEAMGLVKAVITQNIDGLHQAGGSTSVIELHGNGRAIVCERCGRRLTEEEEMAILAAPGLPTCAADGGMVRPDVVLFGEPLPEEALRVAFSLAGECRSMLVVGTSGMVIPASTLPYEARRRGAKIIEVNLQSTALTPTSHVSLFDSVDLALPALLQALKQRNSEM
jgi:NAD-dependent deacetylase